MQQRQHVACKTWNIYSLPLDGESLLNPAVENCVVRLYHNLLFYSTAKGYLVVFSSYLSWSVQCLHVRFGVYEYTFLLGIYPEVELLEYKVWRYSVLVNTAKQSYKLTHLSTVIGNSSCSTSLPILGVTHLFNFGHFSVCVVVSPCGFGLYSPDASWHTYFFMCLLNIYVFLLWHSCSHVLSKVCLYLPYWLVRVSNYLLDRIANTLFYSVICTLTPQRYPSMNRNSWF